MDAHPQGSSPLEFTPEGDEEWLITVNLRACGDALGQHAATPPPDRKSSTTDQVRKGWTVPAGTAG